MDTWISLSCYKDLWKLLRWLVKVVLCISCSLANKTKLKFDQDIKALKRLLWAKGVEWVQSTQCLGSAVPLEMFVYEHYKSFLSFGVSLMYFFRGEEVESEYRAAQKARARISVSQTLDNFQVWKIFSVSYISIWNLCLTTLDKRPIFRAWRESWTTSPGTWWLTGASDTLLTQNKNNYKKLFTFQKWNRR